MSFSTSVISGAISLVSAEAYTRHIGTNHKQLFGVALAALLNTTRPYTEHHLKKWFDERSLDYIYGTSSILIMGLAAHFGGLSLRVNILSTLFFTVTQIATYKVVASFFTTITAQQLARFKTDTFHGGNFLMDQILSTRVQHADRDQSCAAYMYVMPGGFMILLAATKGYPAFSYTHTGDGTEVERLRCCPFQTINLSQRAYDRLVAMSRQVDVINLDGTRQREQWDLQGIPPCVCIEGRWNQIPQPYGTHVDLETLILENAGQQHEAFELRVIDPTWQRIAQTPNLRGLSFNHSVARFNIWVHEKNDNVLDREQQELVSQIAYLQSCIEFITAFETAAFQFATPPIGGIQRQKLNEWAVLARGIPFRHAAQNYSDLPDLVRAQGGSDGVMERFRLFFQNLPQEACFATDYVAAEGISQCYNEFRSSQNDLVRTQAYINTNKLKEWLTMLRFASLSFGTSPALTQLINDSQEYLDINNVLRSQQAAAQDPVQQARRIELDPILKDGYTDFFQAYHLGIQRKGEFVQDLKGAIVALENKQRKLEVFTLCHQPAGHFVAAAHLQTHAGLLDVKKLQALSGMLELIYDSDAQRSALLQNSKSYVQLDGMIANFQLQQPTLGERTQARAQLIPLILNGYNWFFNTYLQTLNGWPQEEFFRRLTTYTECPRSHVASTAQIEFYSKIDRQGLHLIIHRNRAEQISKLVFSMGSYASDDNLPQPFFDKFKPVYDRVCDFVVRKAQSLEFEVNPSWEHNEQDVLQVSFSQRRVDRNKYKFKDCQSRNGQDVFRLLQQVSQVLSGVYANVNQKNYAAYCVSPFLEEEVGLLEELYAITHELFFLSNTSVRWNTHLQLHKDSVMTRKARTALAGGNYFIYKRIEDGGNVVSDVVRGQEVSELSRREEVHTAIYKLYQ